MPTVTSLDDLKTRVESGYTQRAYKEGKDPSGEEGSSIAQFLLGFDDEDEVDNTTVSILKPMYQAFLIDIQTKREQSYFSETVMSLSKDSAEKGILLLRFLQYPSLVRRARLESLLLSAWSAPNQPHSPIPQDFPLLDIAEDIALNGTIGAFCRKVISTNEEYHASILSSAITLLSYVGRSKLIDTSPTSSSKQEKSFVREIIFQGKSDSFGFSALRNDLALIAKSRFDLSARTISSLITLQINVLILILECKLKAQEIMDNDDEGKQDFYEALLRHKNEYEDLTFQMQLMTIGMSSDSKLRKNIAFKLSSTIEGVKHSILKMEKIKCDKESCENEGTMQCSRCKCVNYCSHKCHEENWEIHQGYCDMLQKKHCVD
jgi:hypothetical protein